MSNKINNSLKAKTPETLEVVANTMSEFREEMEYFDEIGIKIAGKTRSIMRVVFTTLILSSVVLVCMIMNMSDNMTIMTEHMEDMYVNFGKMSDDMHAIVQSVDSMDKEISGIPAISESMFQINGDVSNMTGSVYEINKSITAIDGDMVSINTNMREMTGRLYNMSYSVNSMSYDVNEMSRPANSGPMSGFWPR